MNAIVEATIYDNITEENGRGEVLATIRGQEHEISALRAENAKLREALKLIAAGDGVYGQQAGEYKSIALRALESSNG